VVLVTGGAGFIGGHFVKEWLAHMGEPLVNLDKLTYAGTAFRLGELGDDDRHQLVVGDIADSVLVRQLLHTHQPRAVVHFAAQTHVDQSIQDPGVFVHTNVVGTYQLLEAVREYWSALAPVPKQAFRFLYVSTDEVYGSLTPGQAPFSEQHPVRPNNPYAATKAAGDHMVRAWHSTYGLPVLTTRGSNSYGPCQLPEKLIPCIIWNALSLQSLPIYGDGSQVRDWIHVSDHCRALRCVLDSGSVGETYNIGAGNECSNLSLVVAICECLNHLHPRPDGVPYQVQIRFVADRPGHDQRYGMDGRKIMQALGWVPLESFEQGLLDTVHWYLNNPEWLRGAAYRVQAAAAGA
jgi:dTDP-glucose 4,6-dehydratase